VKSSKWPEAIPFTTSSTPMIMLSVTLFVMKEKYKIDPLDSTALEIYEYLIE
jgi:hypothetical protein